MMNLMPISSNNTVMVQESISQVEMVSKFIAFIDTTPQTARTYTRAIRQYLKWLHENEITQPERADILRYREELKATHKPTTVQGYITAVRLLYQWASQEGIYKNIADHVKGAKLDTEHKKDELDEEQVRDVLAAAQISSEQGLRDYAILALMFTGGLRTIEVSRADVCDLRHVQGQTRLYIQGKGREEKTDFITLIPEVENAIRNYLEARGPVMTNAPLFCSTSNNSMGERLSTRSVSGIVKTALRRAGYDSDRLTAHSTRHTAVTLALKNGRPLPEVQQFARHKHISTTMIYAHHLDRAKNQCENTIGKAIFG